MEIYLPFVYTLHLHYGSSLSLLTTKTNLKTTMWSLSSQLKMNSSQFMSTLLCILHYG